MPPLPSCFWQRLATLANNFVMLLSSLFLAALLTFHYNWRLNCVENPLFLHVNKTLNLGQRKKLGISNDDKRLNSIKSTLAVFHANCKQNYSRWPNSVLWCVLIFLIDSSQYLMICLVETVFALARVNTLGGGGATEIGQSGKVFGTQCEKLSYQSTPPAINLLDAEFQWQQPV